MKNKEYKNINFSPVVLYRDDLYELESILNNELKVAKLEVSFSEYESNDFASIPEDTKSANDLSIQTHSPHISIEINKYGNRIWAGENSLLVEGCISKIQDIFNRNKRSIALRVYHFIARTSLGASFITVFFLSATIQQREVIAAYLKMTKEIYVLIFGTLSVGFFMLWVLLLLRPVKSIIFFTKRTQTPNFWHRNRDQIVVSIISSIIGTIAGVIFTLILT